MSARLRPTIVDVLHRRGVQEADARAYTFVSGPSRDASMTYGELHRAALAVAGALIDRGATGQPVILAFPSGLDFLAAFFGCMYAGAIAVPTAVPRSAAGLDGESERLRAICADCQPALLLTTGRTAGALRTLLGDADPAIEVLAADQIDPRRARSEPLRAEADGVAFLQYTSGSTSTPRGVIVRHGNIAANQEMIAAAFGHDRGSVAGGWLPAFHDMGLIGNLLQPLYVGFPCVFMAPIGFIARPMSWLRLISEYGLTTSGAPNFAYELCVARYRPDALEGVDLSGWQVAFCGAEPVQRQTLERFAACFAPHGFRASSLLPCYGLAESTLFVAGVDHRRAPRTLELDSEALARGHAEAPRPEGRRAAVVSCGAGQGGQELRIVDPETARVLPEGSVGEIWIRGDHVAAGYWNRPEDSTATFRGCLDEQGPFLRTGDLGFLQDGELYVTGRSKDVIIVRGRNHYPQDIERTVAGAHPQLRPSSVIAFADPDEPGLHVAIELDRKGVLLADRDWLVAARRAVSERHGLRVARAYLLAAGTLPRTSSGKLRRRACGQRIRSGELPVVEVDARSRPGPTQAEAAT